MNQVVAWSQLELVKYNVPNIMKDMTGKEAAAKAIRQ